MLAAACTVLALVAFAANSVLCRLALRDDAIDAASFSSIRLVSGAAALLVVVRSLGGSGAWRAGSWPSAVLLFLYAVPFSFAYRWLTAGTGALILFGCVQLTMLAGARWSGERGTAAQWVGLASALAGLVYLLSPGLSAPSPAGATLMAVAGVSWGGYSLRGRGSVDALRDSTGNFVRTVPLALALTLLTLPGARVSAPGAWLALASGILGSGLGYVIWYAALRDLTATRAAIVQLSVPLLAAVGAVVLLDERLSLRLLVAAAMILGGIGVALAAGGGTRDDRA